MAKLIKVDGTVLEVHPENSETGFTLQELYNLIGCTCIEAPFMQVFGLFMILDEEGKLKDNPRINVKASAIYATNNGFNDVIVGNVVLCDENEFK